MTMGYCPETQKIMSDQDKVLLALKQLNESGVFSMGWNEDGMGSFSMSRYKYIPYQSETEILEKNPDCCSVKYYEAMDGKSLIGKTVDKWKLTKTWQERGGYAGHVHVKYAAKFLSKEDGTEKLGIVREFGSITNCGKYSWLD